ncbi:TPM domain-containing protein [Winogradskyella psychrotolerans]|uniref:TPM domain-containing protein n=1 Tax=Winogradskyella psychrotolerans TaxID=1344585 RepID=UPI001C071438|nr:TPM domain-containing protein [Winogradskyella psychrotolerans]MBU2927130.1 TPM domain-containing protein [Winogradskyella psychrotolerans]
MRLKLIISIFIFPVLLLNCKRKQPETSAISTYIPLNPSQQRVVDASHLFSSSQQDSLIDKIIQYETETTNQIAILTVDSLPPLTTAQAFGTDAGNSWGIGTKEKDNGLIITISKFDKAVAISTGTGTAQSISDYECQVIIDSLMLPKFRSKKYYFGVDKALDALILHWN